MQMDWEKIKPGLWGAVGGAIALAIIGFSWGGWVTGGAAKEMAEQEAENAVVARLAPICVEQFNQVSEKDQKLKELKETDSWKRREYVDTQGWAIMPGEKESDRMVAERCAELLAELGQ
jgi:alpha/beta superfamily hydrolase